MEPNNTHLPPQPQKPPPERGSRQRLWLIGGFLVVLAIVIIAVALVLRGGGGGAHEDHGGHGVEAAGAAEPHAHQMYTCPMHPTVRTSNPNDRCPICGMALIPVPGDADDDADAALPRLSVTPRAAALMQVRTWPAERREVMRPLRFYGRIAPDETRLRTISAWVPGRLDRLYVDFTGMQVSSGDPMVLVFSPMLISAQEELLQAARAAQQLAEASPQSLRRGTEARATAARDRLRLLGLSAERIERIVQEGTVQDQLTVPAPVDGTVIQRHAAQGDYVDTGEPIYTIADLSQVWVNLEAYEQDLPWIRLGQEVAFSVEAYPGEKFEGTVSFVQPVLEDRTRTVRVRVEVPNPHGLLKPGMFVTGTVHASVAETARPMLASVGQHLPEADSQEALPLVIPASAPLITGQRAVVYVQVPDADRPTFEGRDVVLGPRAGDWYVVREGLAEGEQVVTHGNFKIDAELQIRGRPSMMAPHGNGMPMHDHGQMHGEGHVPVPHTHPPAEEPRQEPAPPQFGISEAFAAQMGTVVQANFALVEALSEDDPDRSHEAAAAARRALGEVDADLLDGAAGDAWRASQARMNRALAAMAEAEDLGELRTHFEPFSDELTRVVRSFGSGAAGPVYRAMCPMVNDRRAYWLQPQRPITNPYWGEAMYRCGDVVETLVE